MIATIIVLIEVTDPKVYYYFIIFVSMMFVYVCVSMHVRVCTLLNNNNTTLLIFFKCIMLYLICDVLYIWGNIKFLLLLLILKILVN